MAHFDFAKLKDFAKMGFGKKVEDRIILKGMFHFRLYDADGNLKEEREVPNTITQLGDAWVADHLSDVGTALASHMAVGTGTGGKSTASTTLETELARVALDSTTQGGGADDNDVIWVATFPAGTGTGALVEAAVLNNAAGGTMIVYTDYAVINKGAADSLVVTWTLTCGAS